MRSPTWRPPRIITRFTAVRPCADTPATTSMSPAVALSTNCRDCSCVRRAILSRRRAARSKASAAAASSICRCKPASTSLVLPCRNSVALAHVLLIVGLGDQPDARTGAALDLIEHARARAVGEHAVLAGAQLEHLLQQRHALAHRAGAGKRAEVAMRLVELAAMEAQLRKASRRSGRRTDSSCRRETARCSAADAP